MKRRMTTSTEGAGWDMGSRRGAEDMLLERIHNQSSCSTGHDCGERFDARKRLELDDRQSANVCRGDADFFFE
jgi:hypothetical protein